MTEKLQPGDRARTIAHKNLATVAFDLRIVADMLTSVDSPGQLQACVEMLTQAYEDAARVRIAWQAAIDGVRIMGFPPTLAAPYGAETANGK